MLSSCFSVHSCLRACPLAPFLSSGLRRSSLSLDLELRVHGACPLLARHGLAIWRVAVSRPRYAPYFLSLRSTGYNFFLDSLMSHQTLAARHNQLLLQVGQAQRVFLAWKKSQRSSTSFWLGERAFPRSLVSHVVLKVSAE